MKTTYFSSYDLEIFKFGRLNPHTPVRKDPLDLVSSTHTCNGRIP